MLNTKFSWRWERRAAFPTCGGTSEIREKSPGEGESWETEPRDATTRPVQSVPAAGADLGGSQFDFIKEANTFPSIQCGLCVAHVIGFQDVKCHPRTEPGKEWAECLFREFYSTIEESGV